MKVTYDRKTGFAAGGRVGPYKIVTLTFMGCVRMLTLAGRQNQAIWTLGREWTLQASYSTPTGRRSRSWTPRRDERLFRERMRKLGYDA